MLCDQPQCYEKRDWVGEEVGSGFYLSKVVRGGLFKQVTFKQKSDGKESVGARACQAVGEHMQRP